MHSASDTLSGRSWEDRARATLAGCRDWLDGRGRFAWIITMILGFVAFWPLGLAILTYMIWSKRMFGCKTRRHTPAHHDSRARFSDTGNAAFDNYRAETLKRLEDEHTEFVTFLTRLREAKDKAEFDQFMARRDPQTQAGTDLQKA